MSSENDTFFAFVGEFQGNYRLHPKGIQIEPTRAEVFLRRVPGNPIYSVPRRLDSIRFGIAEQYQHEGKPVWRVISWSEKVDVGKTMNPGDQHSLYSLRFFIPIDKTIDLSTRWLTIEIAETSSNSVGVAYIHSGKIFSGLGTAISGSQSSAFETGMAYFRKKDFGEAVKWFRQAGEQGHSLAQGYLGNLYDTGRGVSQNYREAVTWYRRAAEQGDPWGQYLLGTMYQAGNGVTKDDVEAVKWFRKAAEQGYAGGQYNLGWMYYYGRGVSRDYREAAQWYRKAAEQGHPHGQRSLGMMYETGTGISQNVAEAARWYREAADQGDAYAEVRLRELTLSGRVSQ
jgi:TPR repeat protein